MAQALEHDERSDAARAQDGRRWPALSRLLYHSLGSRLGDNRNWLAIDDWARSIATALRAPSPR